MKKRPVEGDNIKSVFGEYRAAAERGQSFVFVNGAWKDTTDSDIKSVLKPTLSRETAALRRCSRNKGWKYEADTGRL